MAVLFKTTHGFGQEQPASHSLVSEWVAGKNESDIQSRRWLVSERGRLFVNVRMFQSQGPIQTRNAYIGFSNWKSVIFCFSAIYIFFFYKYKPNL